MDIHDATEQAYKNGYRQGVKDLADRLKGVYANDKRYDRPRAHTMLITLFANIDRITKEIGVKDETIQP